MRFAVGEQTQTITVAATDDAVDDDGESVSLFFLDDRNDRVTTGAGPITTTVALEDDDGPAPVTVGYPGALDRGSTPSPRDFVVSAEAPGGGKAIMPVAAVAVRGSDVFLQLARPALPEDTVTLSYLANAMHPIRDAAGGPAPPLTDAPCATTPLLPVPGWRPGFPSTPRFRRRWRLCRKGRKRASGSSASTCRRGA